MKDDERKIGYFIWVTQSDLGEIEMHFTKPRKKSGHWEDNKKYDTFCLGGVEPNFFENTKGIKRVKLLKAAPHSSKDIITFPLASVRDVIPGYLKKFDYKVSFKYER